MIKDIPYKERMVFNDLSTITITMPAPDEILDTAVLVKGDTTLPVYKQTLEKIGQLSPDWDGYDAPAISKGAIKHCENVMSLLPNSIANNVEILPTEFGGVQIKYKTAFSAVISCDFGDKTMSYYLDVPDHKTEYNDFLSYSPENITILADKIKALG